MLAYRLDHQMSIAGGDLRDYAVMLLSEGLSSAPVLFTACAASLQDSGPGSLDLQTAVFDGPMGGPFLRPSDVPRVFRDLFSRWPPPPLPTMLVKSYSAHLTAYLRDDGTLSVHWGGEVIWSADVADLCSLGMPLDLIFHLHVRSIIRCNLTLAARSNAGMPDSLADVQCGQGEPRYSKYFQQSVRLQENRLMWTQLPIMSVLVMVQHDYKCCYLRAVLTGVWRYHMPECIAYFKQTVIQLYPAAGVYCTTRSPLNHPLNPSDLQDAPPCSRLPLSHH